MFIPLLYLFTYLFIQYTHTHHKPCTKVDMSLCAATVVKWLLPVVSLLPLGLSQRTIAHCYHFKPTGQQKSHYFIHSITIFGGKTKDCTRSGSFQHKMHHRCRAQSLNLSFGAFVLPDVNFQAHHRNFRRTAENFRSTAVGSIYFKTKSKKLNSATFICHLQFVTFTSVL